MRFLMNIYHKFIILMINLFTTKGSECFISCLNEEQNENNVIFSNWFFYFTHFSTDLSFYKLFKVLTSNHLTIYSREIYHILTYYIWGLFSQTSVSFAQLNPNG